MNDLERFTLGALLMMAALRRSSWPLQAHGAA
jgi:hypothetical protein